MSYLNICVTYLVDMYTQVPFFNLKYLFLGLCVPVCVSICHLCRRCPQKTKEDVGFLGDGVTWTGYWEFNSCPLEEQQVFKTHEQFVNPFPFLKLVFCCCWIIDFICIFWILYPCLTYGKQIHFRIHSVF